MDLGQFKTYILNFRPGHLFDYGISEPFSWRGIYGEVAFAIEEKSMTREEILKRIDKALTETFIGYKGGEYHYTEHTPVHFESGRGSYTGGEYCKEHIEKLIEDDFCSEEYHLVTLLFPT